MTSYDERLKQVTEDYLKKGSYLNFYDLAGQKISEPIIPGVYFQYVTSKYKEMAINYLSFLQSEIIMKAKPIITKQCILDATKDGQRVDIIYMPPHDDKGKMIFYGPAQVKDILEEFCALDHSRRS
jgi:hypothetical protein